MEYYLILYYYKKYIIYNIYNESVKKFLFGNI